MVPGVAGVGGQVNHICTIVPDPSQEHNVQSCNYFGTHPSWIKMKLYGIELE